MKTHITMLMLAGTIASTIVTTSALAQGSLPDLKADTAERIASAATTPGGNSVRLRVTVANVSTVNLPAVSPKAPGWNVQIVGIATPDRLAGGAGGSNSVTESFRAPLNAGQRHTFVTSITLPCGMFTLIRVLVDPTNRIAEASESNNRATYLIEGNKCQ